MEITHIVGLLGALVGIIGIFFKRQEITALAHKDYTAKLDSTNRFFENFFEKDGVRRLVLDRAAQELARLDYVDYDFICYLVKLHEARLINLDQIIRLYKSGRKFIEYTPQQNVSASNFTLKIKDGRSVKKQVIIFGAQYFFFALLLVLPFLLASILSNWLPTQVSLFVYFFGGAYLFGCFLLALMGLLDSENIKDAENFLNKINEADAPYLEITKQKMMEESKNKRIITLINE